MVTRHTADMSAERTKRYRQRKRAGLRMATIAIEPTAVAELLIDHDFLREWDAADFSAVCAALQEAIAVWAQA
jgi:hypothetical protein